MASFKNYYRTVFDTFGYPLTERTAMSSEVLDAAQERLAVQIPAALRDYYLVAGRERRFNMSCERLLPPPDWEVNKHRLIFMEENQSVGWWGVSTRNPNSDDPPVSFGMNDEPIAWHPEQRKCSVFLALMLHHQAVSDGFRFCGRAQVPDKLGYLCREHGWTFYGEMRGTRTYSRPNQVLCFEPPANLPSAENWSALVGGKTKRDLQAITAELGLTVR